MLAVNGLYGHIARNQTKSAVLLAGFAALFMVYWIAVCLAWTALFPPHAIHAGRNVVRHATTAIAFDHLVRIAFARALSLWYVPMAGVGLWFTLAWMWHGAMIRAATGAEPVSRIQEPRLYNLVENLAIAAGLPMPRVEIIETQELNAYAAGLSPDTATIAVTRGLLRTLSPDELEAVLAHEMTHIKNYDVRLMMVALIFCGGLTLVGRCFGQVMRASRATLDAGDIYWIWRLFSWRGRRSNESGVDAAAAGAAFLAFAIAVVLFAMTHLAALLSQFAISRSREYMADGGAVELTKNPDALISALRKISGDDDVPLAAESLRAMMISCSIGDGVLSGLFSTHPAMDDRIHSLVQHAGGRERAAHPSRRARVQAGGQPSIMAPAGSMGFAGSATGRRSRAAPAIGGARAEFGRRRA